jgi:hypothetical protein
MTASAVILPAAMAAAAAEQPRTALKQALDPTSYFL